VPALNTLYQNYRDDAAFYVVYIQEAHPIDAWQVEDNVRDDVLIASTTTAEERANVAETCVIKLAIKLPALIDGADIRVEGLYTGWPDRLYVIDRDGKVFYKSAAGPFGFKPAQVEAALKQLLPERQ
jgi:type I thyroxine 5'-deiodinase